jgi:signal transduction histidine kinase
VIVAGWGGYVLAARALAPVDRITHTAERIAAGTDNLSARLNLPPTDDEVGRLARTFDGMLARLDEAFRRERQFTADASHELRTPLTAMQAILSLVRDKPRTPEEYQEALGDLDYEAGRLRALTEALLRLARSEAPDAAPHEAIDLSALLTDLADSLRPVAAAKSLSLDCAVAAGLIVCGDRDDLIRLFANLIDNAVKFTERGGLCLEADRAHHDAVRVLIADTGPGIAADHLPRIFDRFYRADPSRSAPGAGLGLSIAAAIARAHAGRIEVSSAVGQGTRFTVVLPSAACGGLR